MKGGMSDDVTKDASSASIGLRKRDGLQSLQISSRPSALSGLALNSGES
jgi:hypothetical protein